MLPNGVDFIGSHPMAGTEFSGIEHALAGSFRAAIYCRLSKDDDLDGESASIANQRDMLENYCEKQGWATNWVTAAQLSSRVLAYGGLGLLFAFTTNSMDLVMSLMQQFRLPPKFAYGILAAYHFFPVVREEYRIVGAALRVRGVKAGPFSTRRLFPMLAHALERSESLAMAMESRGFESRQPRAVAFRVPLRAVDFLFLIGLNGALAAALFFL